MTERSQRLVWAVPGAIAGAFIVLLLDPGATWPMIVLSAAAGAAGTVVIAGVVQERARRD